MTNKKHEIWLVGAGGMSMEYGKVLKALKKDYLVIGRGRKNANGFRNNMKVEVVEGGLDSFLKGNPDKPDAAIVAVGIENLSDVSLKLMRYGVHKILLEKPGIAYPKELGKLVSIQKKRKARVVLAYNRRFYASTRQAREIIKRDGGVRSFVFEFTEWSHMIARARKTKAEWNNWFLGNSTHVIDTAFYLGGKPNKLISFVKGKLAWHPKSSIFAGAGETTKGALFSYYANWESPGRWSVELMTRKHRLILRPMETLQIQKIGSIEVKNVPVDYSLDKKYKPGLYLQTKAFLEGQYDDFCTLDNQRVALKYYKKMSRY